MKGSIAVKIYGPDPAILEGEAGEIQKQLATLRGIENLGVIRTTGQPEMRIELDERKLAVYGINKSDAEAVIEMAISGKAATRIYEDERKFDLRTRYDRAFRSNEQQIS